METHEQELRCTEQTHLLAPVRKHHKSWGLNPTSQPNARQQTQSKPRRHNRPTVQCHGHQRNCRTETCRVFPAPPGVQEPLCPRHHTNLTPLFKQRAAPPMQVNHSVVFTDTSNAQTRRVSEDVQRAGSKHGVSIGREAFSSRC